MWYGPIFSTISDVLDFVNGHKLQPGKFLVLTEVSVVAGISWGTRYTVVYYSDKELT